MEISMEFKFVMTDDKCSCYIRKTENSEYEQYFIEGEEHIVLECEERALWLLDYIQNSLGLDSKPGTLELEKKLKCEIINYGGNKEIIDLLKKNLGGAALVNLSGFIKKLKLETDIIFRLNDFLFEFLSKEKQLRPHDQKSNSLVYDFVSLLNYKAEKNKKPETTKIKKEEKLEVNQGIWVYNNYYMNNKNVESLFKKEKVVSGVVSKVGGLVIIKDNDNSIDVSIKDKEARDNLKEDDEIGIIYTGYGIVVIKK
jgi:hypothetical protein